MIKKKYLSILLTAFLLSACGDEGSGNLTVSGGVVSSSSAIALQMSDHMGLSGPRILADSGINPTSFLMTIHKVGFSKSTDCTNMTVMTIDDVQASNWVEAPDLVQGNLPDGTYLCVAFEMTTTIQITPEETSTSGNCVAGQEFDMNVGSSGTSTLLDGTTSDLTTSDRMAVYISTQGSQGEDCGQNCALTPEDPTYLSAPLVVNGAKQGQFTVDAQGSIADASGSCEMDEPSWGFL